MREGVGGVQEVEVVTDSTAMVPEELIKELSITVVPAKVIFGHEVYSDGVDLTPAGFYRKLAEAGAHPTTSQPSPGQYLKVFAELARRAKSIICLTPARSLSGIFASAAEAMNLFLEQRADFLIEVLDTRTATASQGLLVLEAARLAQRNLSLVQIRDRIIHLSKKTRVYAGLDTLKYLARGGRIGRAAELLGTLLQIKPIVTLSDGLITPVLRVRTREQVLQSLLGLLETDAGHGLRWHIAVMHSEALAQAEELARRIRARFDPFELHILTMTPALGVHSGPGVLGIAYYNEKIQTG